MIPAKPAIHSPSAYSDFVPERVTRPIAITARSHSAATSPSAPDTAVTLPFLLPNTPLLQSRIQVFQKNCRALRLSELSRYFPSAWSSQDSTIAIEYYGYFLGLIDLYPDRELVPTPLLDYIWHRHILDTQRYRRDCLALFGQFIDHQPWGESDRPGECAGSAEETRQLLRYHFNLGCAAAIDAIDAIEPALLTQSTLWQTGACGRGISP
jgi:hypothetical protein